MINIDNLKQLLKSLNFKNKGEIFSKDFQEIDSYLKVDFKKKELIYPTDKGFKINEKQTCNFSQNENFVVFECVNRLFEKGYKPEHIELEPKWKVGHGAKGGRADILISDNGGNPLLIIECKTFGKEFEKAWKDTCIDGDQLFSYAQQIPATEFLCLYSSSIIDNEVKYVSHIISHKDNKIILEESKNLKSFDKAKNVKDRYLVWKDTYQLEFTTKGLFEKNIQPYNIGKDKYTIEDLLPIDARNKEGKYHEFRTILRKHNISGRENAFDVLVNLFLCKIVDETNNKEDLRFYWKGIAYDNYFDLIDRLQELYKIGMDKFLDQEIVYISKKEIDDAFWTVKQKRNATKKQIKDYFRQLKFFTKNDFGFIDVHNERLFYSNAKVLLEIVQMWQDLRIKTEEHNQFLGDMFEYFLDNGVKQSEGQFFTPMPVCKFILMSLPLENIIESAQDQPKAVDYACGAGHFLTELAGQITPYIKKYKQADTALYYKEIYGIEKEYRLSKVAKLSSFMYGHEGIQILANDALDIHEKIKDNTFNILVANPPFAVDGFLETLSEEQRNKYELLETIVDIAKNDNIECFFIERAKMLLAPGGVAGIIIPTSILSNWDNTHTRTREIILQYFDIISLVELGRNTFSKTPANTVVLFLKRKVQKPEPAEHYKNRVDDWFDGSFEDEDNEVYQDISFLKKYCEHIEIPFEDYKTLLKNEPSDEFLEHELICEYISEFESSSDYKKLKEKATTAKYTDEDKEVDIRKKQIEFIQKIEKDKLYYFILTCSNPSDVIVVKSPNDVKELKQYRGYDWSGAKGNEGIKYNGGDTVDKIITPLYDPNDRYNNNKINYYIQQNYLGNNINEVTGLFEKIPLAELLRFKDKKFDKRIWLTREQQLTIESKYDLVKLDTICTIVRGASPRPIEKYITNEKNGVNWIKIGDVNENDKYITKTAERITIEGATKSRAVNIGDFILSNSMSFGRPYICKISGYIHDGWLLMTNFSGKINKDYLYEILSYESTQLQFSHSAAGGVVKNLNKERVKNTKIPLPPITVQESILKAIETFEKDKNKYLKGKTVKDYEEIIKQKKNEIIKSFIL